MSEKNKMTKVFGIEVWDGFRERGSTVGVFFEDRAIMERELTKAGFTKGETPFGEVWGRGSDDPLDIEAVYPIEMDIYEDGKDMLKCLKLRKHFSED